MTVTACRDSPSSSRVTVSTTVVCGGQTIISDSTQVLSSGTNKLIYTGSNGSQTCSACIQPCTGTWGGVDECEDICGACASACPF